jgi:hypothetical protein
MIKAILLDFSWVILHPTDRSYEGKLNDLNRRLAGEDPLAPYDFNNYFLLNEELLDKVKALKVDGYNYRLKLQLCLIMFSRLANW